MLITIINTIREDSILSGIFVAVLCFVLRKIYDKLFPPRREDSVHRLDVKNSVPPPLKEPPKSHSSIPIGSKMSFGRYGFHELEWRVLDIQNNKALLLCDRVILSKKFHHKWWITFLRALFIFLIFALIALFFILFGEELNHLFLSIPMGIFYGFVPWWSFPLWLSTGKNYQRLWQNSSIRHFLSKEFYNSFNHDEKAKICDTELITNHYSNTVEITKDKIFLLSFDDVRTLLSSNPNGIEWNNSEISDDDNIERVAFDLNRVNVAWWLRSGGRGYQRGLTKASDCNIDFVWEKGEVVRRAASVNQKNVGVRPALWYKLD